MNLKSYLLEYVSSGRGKYSRYKDNLPDDFIELIGFIEELGYEEEEEFDVYTERKVYFYMDSGGWPKKKGGKWLYAKNPAVGKDEILFIEIETMNGKVSNITKFEIQTPGGVEDINLKEALEYLRK